MLRLVSFLRKTLQNAQEKTIFCVLFTIHILLESLPISSSTHLRFLNSFMAYVRGTRPLSIDSTTLDLMHLPTFFVIALYLLIFYSIYQPAFELVIGWCSAAIIAASITGVCYLSLKNKEIISQEAGLFLSGCALISLYFVNLGSGISVPITHAILIGFAQSLALLPGVSRLAVTCVTAIWLGIDPVVSIMFSLLMEFFLIASALGKALIKSENQPLPSCSSQWLFLSSVCSLSFCME
jgi:undecaprenyl pyrophosphate phosphatase UppP